MKNQLINNIIVGVCGTLLLFFYGSVWAMNWTVRPSLSVEEIYSDNINLSSSNEKSAFITEISPAVSINSNSSVNSFNLNYRMQNLYNAGGDSGIDIKNQLQMDSNFQLFKDRLYLDSSASISQQNTSNRRIVSDNISGGNNSTTVSTVHFSPYWTPHFKSFADGDVRITYDRVDSDSSAGALSKTDSFSQNVRLTSGRDFSRVGWSLSFNNSKRYNDDSDDVSFQDSTAEIRYAIGREFSIFARGGHSNNSFASNSSSNNNGLFYTAGAQWQPSQRLRVQAGYGNNKFVTVEISPFNRLHWITTYSKNDVGLNTGDQWNSSLIYNTRRSDWRLSYSEQTLTTQQLLLELQTFTVPLSVVDSSTGDFFRDPVTNEPILVDVSFSGRVPTLTDEVFISKTAELSASFHTGKSDLSASVYRIQREFEISGNTEKVIGASASWNWQFSRRTSFLFSSGWQKTKSNGINAFSDKRFNISARATRNILSRLNGYAEYRFIDQNSNDNLNSYTENRATVGLSLQF